MTITGLFLVEAANNVLMFIAAIEDHSAVVQERWKKEQSDSAAAQVSPGTEKTSIAPCEQLSANQ